jgi:hypothetical protein
MGINVNIPQMDEVASHMLINTLLQRGVGAWRVGHNRFSGFPHLVETVETVPGRPRVQSTPLKQGVNETSPMKAGNFVIGSDTRKAVHA